LNSTRESVRNLTHERSSIARIATAYVPTDNKLAVSIDSVPCADIAIPEFALMLRRNILGRRVAERPHFIALPSLAIQIAEVRDDMVASQVAR
jgi:hypothetical protein